MATKLTSVKICIDLQKRFKKDCIEEDMNLQKLVNRALHLYLYDAKFKNKIKTVDNLGSKL
tara:strand:+ start:46 stop:228 length:183 start_codon:yes stop_codon:yes gene_type:complete